MASEVLNEFLSCLGPAEDVVNNHLGVQCIIDSKVMLNGKGLPSNIQVMDKDNKRSWSIGRAEGHYQIGIFGTVGACKGKFSLRIHRDSDLIVARDCVGKPTKFRVAESVPNGGVATWDWHSDEFSDRVEGNIVHAKAPDKVVYVSDILLMGLRG